MSETNAKTKYIFIKFINDENKNNWIAYQIMKLTKNERREVYKTIFSYFKITKLINKTNNLTLNI